MSWLERRTWLAALLWRLVLGEVCGGAPAHAEPPAPAADSKFVQGGLIGTLKDNLAELRD